MRTLTFSLGDREYTIPVAPIKRAAAWRRALQQPLTDVLSALTIDLSAGINTTADLVALADQLLPLLADAPERLLELLFRYAPDLESSRDHIEANAIDEEVIEAFVVVIKAAFPLGRLTSLLGSANPPISTSSPAPNGVLTTTESSDSTNSSPLN